MIFSVRGWTLWIRCDSALQDIGGRFVAEDARNQHHTPKSWRETRSPKCTASPHVYHSLIPVRTFEADGVQARASAPCREKGKLSVWAIDSGHNWVLPMTCTSVTTFDLHYLRKYWSMLLTSSTILVPLELAPSHRMEMFEHFADHRETLNPVNHHRGLQPAAVIAAHHILTSRLPGSQAAQLQSACNGHRPARVGSIPFRYAVPHNTSLCV
jgi:hypothetical protein